MFIGCASTAVQHTVYQQQIDQKQDKLNDDAKDFLVKATEMLRVGGGTVDMKRVHMLLEKSQSLLGVDVDDGKELKNLNGEELDKAVNKVVEDAEKEKQLIEELEKKNAEAVGQLVTQNIEYETLKKDQESRNRKFYTTCFIIVAVIGAAMYFLPSGSTKGLLSIFKK